MMIEYPAMTTIEFDSAVGPEGQIQIPSDLVPKLPAGKPLHIVLRWDGPGDEDSGWRAAGNQRFEAAYAPEDSVYDQLAEAV